MYSKQSMDTEGRWNLSRVWKLMGHRGSGDRRPRYRLLRNAAPRRRCRAHRRSQCFGFNKSTIQWWMNDTKCIRQKCVQYDSMVWNVVWVVWVCGMWYGFLNLLAKDNIEPIRDLLYLRLDITFCWGKSGIFLGSSNYFWIFLFVIGENTMLQPQPNTDVFQSAFASNALRRTSDGHRGWRGEWLPRPGTCCGGGATMIRTQLLLKTGRVRPGPTTDSGVRGTKKGLKKGGRGTPK